MKRIILAISSVLLFFTATALADTVTVITKQSAIRENCRFFAPVKAQVKYNDAMEALSMEGDWYRVKFGAIAGCIHKSSVESRASSVPILFGRQSSGVSESETALAGKGFNPQVEASFKRKHPEMKYHLVDNIESYPVTEREVARFITAGRLLEP